MKMIDFFAGLGGMSEAFVNDLDWKVLRMDNNQLLNNVPHMVIYDIKKFLEDLKTKIVEYPFPEIIDYIHFSPPCLEFSNAYNAPASIAKREGLEYNPDMSLLEASIEIIDILQPRFWSIENVIGSIKYFTPYLGKPKQIIGSYVFWGNFPMLDIDIDSIPRKNTNDKGPSNPLRANYRALIPFQISEAMKNTIESQKTLTYWFD